jgi:hypothetical protein
VLVEILKINQNKTLYFLKKLGYRIRPTSSPEDFYCYPNHEGNLNEPK